YLEGKGQGGQAHTAGYALWTLENGGWTADDTTAAAAEYLLLFQKDLDHWKPQTERPPSEGSPFATTYVALRGLRHFATAAQAEGRSNLRKRAHVSACDPAGGRLMARSHAEQANPDVLRVGLSARGRPVHFHHRCRLGDHGPRVVASRQVSAGRANISRRDPP